MYSVFLLLLLILQCNGHQDIHSSHSLVVYEVFQNLRSTFVWVMVQMAPTFLLAVPFLLFGQKQDFYCI